jgi:hypothetical protein
MREVWRVSYFVPSAAGASIKLFLSIILKKSTSQFQPFFNSKDDLNMQTSQ